MEGKALIFSKDKGESDNWKWEQFKKAKVRERKARKGNMSQWDCEKCPTKTTYPKND